MRSEDIHDRGRHWGVRALKSYLEYGRNGIIPDEGVSLGGFESEFEEWVAGVLKAQGYEAVPQFGVAGYRLDLAVRHPRNHGRFLCGIECDGAAYHSAKSARDRDRLRDEVLKKLGWDIYRIWSTDWFRNPATQTKRMIDHIDRLASG
jgi:very-short-patch-repair endonuclease